MTFNRSRGGATFTMLIFLLLLISSGLMYYYFNRCQVLESELSKWRNGTKTHEEASSLPPIERPKSQTLLERATKLHSKIVGTPPPGANGVSVVDKTPAPEPTQEPPPVEEPKPTKKPEAAREENTPELAPEEALPSPSPSPRTGAHVAGRPSPAANTPKPVSTPEPTPANTKSTPITSMYDLEPTVRVRSPKRTPANQ